MTGFVFSLLVFTTRRVWYSPTYLQSVYSIVFPTSSQKVTALLYYLNISRVMFHKSRIAVEKSVDFVEHFVRLRPRLIRENAIYFENKAAARHQ